MPIPDFDHNNVLPPHLGNPADPSHVSPYECTSIEFCLQFSTSPSRIILLKNFIQFRSKIREMGLNYGYQWLDGSFLEDIEKSENRSPNDIDVVTFFGGASMDLLENVNSEFPEFFNPKLSKSVYKMDHYAVQVDYNPFFTVESARYWIQLFTHKRNGVWKGMVKIPLNSVNEDEEALNYLNTLT
ncbi:hypothetical protein [Chryseobacterium sp. WX]|uniref:DUF6932 family protein n=1 Tax=Chryseobacterium sp. WX TaxID=3031803 RepID=UPI002408FFBF|nr:hypothetical protein [Chryseobacterium sp. WX]WFB67092.1 hypothetical protein PZ898_20610 [Chryseobacterium sp. WX]